MIWFAGCSASSGTLWHLWCSQYLGNTWKPITCIPHSPVAVGWLNNTGWSQLLGLFRGDTALYLIKMGGGGKRRDVDGARQFHSFFLTIVVSLFFSLTTHPPLPKSSMVINTVLGIWAVSVLKIKSWNQCIFLMMINAFVKKKKIQHPFIHIQSSLYSGQHYSEYGVYHTHTGLSGWDASWSQSTMHKHIHTFIHIKRKSTHWHFFFWRSGRKVRW